MIDYVPPSMRSAYRQGVLAAADVAATYNASTTHPHRLDDCILAKLNLRKQKPRANEQHLQNPEAAWAAGFAVALAEMHRRLVEGNDSTGVREVARAAGLTLKIARKIGVDARDVKELKRAGVR
jgi:hypothetical protein